MDQLVSLLKMCERAVLVSHVRPDGDAVGSLLGLTYGLHSLGVEVQPVLLDGVPKAFTFLQDAGIPVTNALPKPDTQALCIVLDAADAARTGDRETVRLYSNRQKLAVIDHHPLGDLEGRSAAYYHNMAASSACEMVYEVLLALGCKITPQIATCLYTGMYTDTSGFRHSNTTPHTMEVAAELLRRGANLRRIVNEIGQQKSIARLKLIGTAMRRVLLGRSRQVAYSVIQNEDLTSVGATPEDLIGIVNQVSVVPDVAFFMMLTEETPGKIKGSLRVPEGKRKISVRPLARLLGGGGHASAAGFEVTGTLKAPGGEGESSWQIT